MEVKIGDDEGIEIKFAGGVIEVSIFGDRGLITISEQAERRATDHCNDLRRGRHG
jgi:hypothetical protein